MLLLWNQYLNINEINYAWLEIQNDDNFLTASVLSLSNKNSTNFNLLFSIWLSMNLIHKY